METPTTKTERVLVTGGSGYVAGYCIVALLERGYSVRATLRSAAKEAEVRASVAAVVDPGDRLSFVVADLDADAGWDAAVSGCRYVLHVASPLGQTQVADEELMRTARDGTLRVLRSAVAAGVERVVMTSSTAASTPLRVDEVGDEETWTSDSDPVLNGYRRSKIASERAAWELMRGSPGSTTLTTILPGAIFGPVLSTVNLGSVQFIERLLRGQLPGVPRLGFCVVDVRDLADLHLRAMVSPKAAGERFIAVSDYLWMDDIAQALRSALGTRGEKVPKRRLPDFVLRLLAWVSPQTRALVPLLGRRQLFSAAKAQRMLGFSPRKSVTTVVDCARSLLDHEARR